MSIAASEPSTSQPSVNISTGRTRVSKLRAAQNPPTTELANEQFGKARAFVQRGMDSMASAGPEERIYNAIFDNDVAALRSLIRVHRDARPRNPHLFHSGVAGAPGNAETSLAVAARLGRVECVELLLGMVDPSETYGEGKNALMALLGKQENAPAIARLLMARIDPNAADRHGNNALMEALRRGAYAAAFELVPRMDILAVNRMGDTALMMATGQESPRPGCPRPPAAHFHGAAPAELVDLLRQAEKAQLERKILSEIAPRDPMQPAPRARRSL